MASVLTPTILLKLSDSNNNKFKLQRCIGLRKIYTLHNLSIEFLPDKSYAVYFKDELLFFKHYLHELQEICKLWNLTLK